MTHLHDEELSVCPPFAAVDENDECSGYNENRGCWFILDVGCDKNVIERS